jgi:hypothetical protein
MTSLPTSSPAAPRTSSLSGYNGVGVTWNVTQNGADAVFDFSNGDTITLTNVNAGDLVYDGLFGYS